MREVAIILGRDERRQHGWHRDYGQRVFFEEAGAGLTSRQRAPG